MTFAFSHLYFIAYFIAIFLIACGSSDFAVLQKGSHWLTRFQ